MTCMVLIGSTDKFKTMIKKSEYNRAVIENFILYYTGVSIDEPGIDNFADALYEHLDSYILEDHVDGIEGDDVVIELK